MAHEPIFDLLSALSDATRSRMLLLLERHELTVSELCEVLQLPQSTVSRHLKVLADGGLVSSRRDGTSRYYAGNVSGEAPVRRLWLAVRESVAASPEAEQDAHRLKGVLASRRSKSQEFFAESANQWDRVRDELFGRLFCVRAMFGFFDPGLIVGDLGCGTGQVAEGLAPYVRHVIAVDGSGEMLQAARQRLREFDNVSIRRGDLEALPIEEAELDAAALVLVLHHLPQPGVVLREAARVVKPGGRLVVVDMLPHGREEYKQQMGHVWLGFSESRISAELADAGFDGVRVRTLPSEPGVKGPTLFVAMARRAPVAPALATSGTARLGTLTPEPVTRNP
jgi:ubiquinone/menaquinone biosynthesis C-methylase UbiE/DNA-binding transcriptional ArsR family regulator